MIIYSPSHNLHPLNLVHYLSSSFAPMSWNHETPSGPVVPNTLLPTTFVPGIALAQPPLGQDTSGTWPLAPAQDFLTTANQLIGTPPPQGPFYGMVPMVPVAPYPGAQPLENGPEPVMTSSLPIRFGAEMAGDVMESGVSRVLRGDGPAVDSFCQPLWQPVLPQPPQCRVPVTTAGPLMPSRELGWIEMSREYRLDESIWLVESVLL